ncbi:sugar phosphate isomerase/epimerase family protein [Pseudarthrobacter sp. J75]|uniref:sugar phosphate isomerase/epimerase family protein n=1 Tax=unclassified Pseudarthrobacter TaxID=2647000 RepID=UPI002E8087AF|nr:MULTISPECIES: sugar phosphate isomerase/epimerase family protein [unclassified Pseudarthrobacter]MEE2522940.1 sugar phosphate isomerase/epimerase family protein [Pseudarthrobacter sp. J47]MEE2529466.1 sugar phosphate isomerase/epimerase family protein [Pseudarthrobacter sp. J75]
MSDFSRLALNTATTKKWTLAEAVEGCVKAGIPSIGPWRDRVAEAGLENAAKMIADAGLRVSSLCRGGFLTAIDAEGQAEALEDNRAAIIEAATLGTRDLFLVVGGLAEGEKDVVAARQRVADRLEQLVPFAVENGVRLVLEPLHPMYAADRALISTLGQSLDLAAPYDASAVGVAVDTFHVWWDPELKAQIERAGRENRIASYQVCDFNMPIAADPLLSRGYMGDGIVDFATIGTWVRDAGYTGDIEVEIFNQDIWDTNGNEVLATVKQRYEELVLPYA